MKKLLTTISLLLLTMISFSQSYSSILKDINSFLSTFDNGYYGYLSIEDAYLTDHYKSGTYSKIPLNQASEARVTQENRSVAIYCKESASCVTNNSGATFDNMPFSTSVDFDASGFASKLNALVTAYNKNKSPLTATALKSNAVFPLRSRVSVLKEDKPFDLSDALNEESGSKEQATGTVIGSDLVSLGAGWYSGRLKLSDGSVKFYRRAQFQMLQ